jgi:hypothetical protein
MKWTSELDGQDERIDCLNAVRELVSTLQESNRLNKVNAAIEILESVYTIISNETSTDVDAVFNKVIRQAWRDAYRQNKRPAVAVKAAESFNRETGNNAEATAKLLFGDGDAFDDDDDDYEEDDDTEEDDAEDNDDFEDDFAVDDAEDADDDDDSGDDDFDDDFDRDDDCDEDCDDDEEQ